MPRWRCWSSAALCAGELAPRRRRRAEGHGRSRRRRRGYRSAVERFGKTRRLAVLRTRLASARGGVGSGPAVDHGGRETLWRNRNHLDATDMTAQQWRTAGMRHECSRPPMVSRARLAAMKPSASTSRAGCASKPGRLVDTVRHSCDHRRADTVYSPRRRSGRGWSARRAVRYDISYDPAVTAGIWTHRGRPAPNQCPSSRICASGPVLGVDLNADHLAACVLDGIG